MERVVSWYYVPGIEWGNILVCTISFDILDLNHLGILFAFIVCTSFVSSFVCSVLWIHFLWIKDEKFTLTKWRDQQKMGVTGKGEEFSQFYKACSTKGKHSFLLSILQNASFHRKSWFTSFYFPPCTELSVTRFYFL